ncbi:MULTISPECIES: hypothetical protein [unclassified Synechocystis]|uniref:hypothetical protein n=1 Tax=unclassified Synechocystis TaxID=2640012 RepID=UPI00040DC73B|nr:MULTISPECIES: hypothetical protein [unclassified Synechocystis]AIE74421.1 S-layer associated multidomain endoglucanase [Synechocystis sp. PCC 6714]MCT0254808.1 hypothetical protein [Synechocystis sp. CS-94]
MFNSLSLSKLHWQARRSTALLTSALLVGGLIGSFAAPVEARPRPNRGNASQNSNRWNNNNLSTPRSNYNIGQLYNVEVPAQTMIPVAVDQGQITLKRGETRAVSLRTTTALRQSDGMTIIPAGSEIIGQFRPIANGNAMQFVAQQLVLNNGEYLPINARSRELVGFQTVNKGASASDVIMGTLAGAGTATIISGTTGDRRITPLEVLGGAAAGALAGWGLPSAGILGGGSEEVLTVSSRDLTLMLQSPLRIGNGQVQTVPTNNNGNWRTASW